MTKHVSRAFVENDTKHEVYANNNNSPFARFTDPRAVHDSKCAMNESAEKRVSMEVRMNAGHL